MRMVDSNKSGATVSASEEHKSNKRVKKLVKKLAIELFNIHPTDF